MVSVLDFVCILMFLEVYGDCLDVLNMFLVIINKNFDGKYVLVF